MRRAVAIYVTAVVLFWLFVIVYFTGNLPGR